MLFIVTVVMFCLNTTLQLLPYEWAPKMVESQLIFYVLLLLLGMNILNMTKDSFNLGVRALSNETKLEMFISAKAFTVVYLVLKSYPSSLMFDFDAAMLHHEMNERINDALQPFGNQPLEIPEDITFGLFGLVAAVLSFVLVRIHLRFAYFFHMTTESDNAVDESDDRDARVQK